VQKKSFSNLQEKNPTDVYLQFLLVRKEIKWKAFSDVSPE